MHVLPLRHDLGDGTYLRRPRSVRAALCCAALRCAACPPAACLQRLERPQHLASYILHNNTPSLCFTPPGSHYYEVDRLQWGSLFTDCEMPQTNANGEQDAWLAEVETSQKILQVSTRTPTATTAQYSTVYTHHYRWTLLSICATFLSSSKHHFFHGACSMPLRECVWPAVPACAFLPPACLQGSDAEARTELTEKAGKFFKSTSSDGKPSGHMACTCPAGSFALIHFDILCVKPRVDARCCCTASG